MEVLYALDECRPLAQGTAVTIGQYDGVHLGHRAVISEVRALAAAQGLATAVVTFDRHPASVVRPESAPRLLTDLDQKLELLAHTGIDYALVIPFDLERSQEPPEEFVHEVLLKCLNARSVVVGEDFHFGHQRKGNVDLLQKMGAEHGFEVAGLDLVAIEGSTAEVVSSTAIRALLAEGDLDMANGMLGRSYEMRGPVVLGDQRGRELGFPTANLALPPSIQMPADGIYAGWYVDSDGWRQGAAISLGRRPTFYENAEHSLLEAHLLDWSGDLYGRRGRVQFVRWLRGEEKFDSLEALERQIAADCDLARDVLEAT